jgi:hypothetical protein
MLNVTTYLSTVASLNYGIYENDGDPDYFTPPGTIIVKAGPEGEEAAVETYLADQSNLELTTTYDWVPGNWYVIKFDSNHANNAAFGGRMRLEANLYVQMFIESI